MQLDDVYSYVGNQPVIDALIVVEL